MVILTGATGMLGAYILYELAKTGEPITAIKRTASSLQITETVFRFMKAQPLASYKNITWVEADITDRLRMLEIIGKEDMVYHCAAMVSFNKADHAAMFETNVAGTAAVADACLINGAKKLCYISSIAALGIAEPGDAITETDKQTEGSKSSGYSQSKFKAELEVWRAAAEGLNAVVLNPSVILGVGDWKNGPSAFFGTVNKGFKYYTKGATGFVDALDVAQLAIMLANSEIKGERYIINAENVSYRTVFSAIAEQLEKPKPNIEASPMLTELAWRLEAVRCFFTGKKPLITKETARSGRSVKTYSNKKIIDTFNYSFISVEKSVADIAAFFPKELKEKK